MIFKMHLINLIKVVNIPTNLFSRTSQCVATVPDKEFNKEVYLDPECLSTDENSISVSE